MAKRPEDRWPSADAFAVEVERSLAPGADPAARRAAAVLRARRAAAARAARPARPARQAPSTTRVRRPTPAETAPRTRRERRVPLGALAGAIASLVVIAAGIVWATSGGPAKHRPLATASTRAPAHVRAPVKHTPPKPHAAPKPKTTSTPTVTAQRAATTTPPPTADTLAAQGHSLITSGNPAGAIPVLWKALSAASPGSLTYAYAMYDLGHAYLLAGNPRTAATILAKRLTIPNQTDVVRNTLRQALVQLGAQASHSGGGAPVPPAHDHGRPRGHGPGDLAPASSD